MTITPATNVTILDALHNAKLFKPWFRDPESWAAWRSFLAALFGLPMSDTELATFQACTGRTTAPTKQMREAWLAVGRRGGKSLTLACCAVFVSCFGKFAQYAVPGERLLIPIIAADRRQARTIAQYCKAMLTEIKMLKPMLVRETADSFELSTGVTIEITTASFRTARGFTSPVILFDEIAFLFSEDTGSANPDVEIIRAIKPSLISIPNSMMVCASSPYAKRGALYSAFKDYYGKDGDVLFWKAPSKTMNPSLPQSVIDDAYKSDPEAASAEYGAEFRSDIASFVDRTAVELCIDRGVKERPPQPSLRYRAFCDPSGGSSDSFALAIAHQEGETVVIDCLREIGAPFSPPAAVAELAKVLKSYRLRTVTGDRYAGSWVSEAFREVGITYQTSELVKSDIYLETLPLINARKIKILDNPKAINQLCNLERRTGRSGKDSVDHPPGTSSHDDLCNSLCGAATLLTTGRKQIAAMDQHAFMARLNPDNYARQSDGTMRYVGVPSRIIPHPTRGR